MQQNKSQNSETKVSVIIPCYNEEAQIASNVKELLCYFSNQPSDITYELILVDDGSTDNTLKEMIKISTEYNQVVVNTLHRHQGRGAALRKGFAMSKGEIVISLDADLSYDTSHIGEILSEFSKSSETDVVVVSAYMKGGATQGVPIIRLFYSRLANWILSGFFDFRLSTVTCVVRGYRGEVIRRLQLYSVNKEIHLEILRKAALLNWKIKEIPGHLKWRRTKNPRRLTPFSSFSGAKEHILYGLLVRPSRFAKYISIILFLIGIYEIGAIANSMIQNFYWHESLARSFWLSLSSAFAQSPHTFVIATLSLVLGMQAATYWALFEILKLQHEETLKHIISSANPSCDSVDKK